MRVRASFVSVVAALTSFASLACEPRVTPGPPGSANGPASAEGVQSTKGGVKTAAAPPVVPPPVFEAPPAPPTTPVTTHPRLWIRAEELPRLRARAVESNPIYRDLMSVVAEAKLGMDRGKIPSEGDCTYERVFCESYAELFAFMALVAPVEAERKDYAARAKKILLTIVDRVIAAADKDPLARRGFSTTDRSRWAGESFGLTADWIYPYLSAEEKARVRRVFLKWADDQLNSSTTSFDHPTPIGKLNDPVILQGRPNEGLKKPRYAANNFYTAHMRNLTLLSLAFDPADDPPDHTGQYPRLRDYFANVAGAWLYATDHLLRNDARGGSPPEGFQYGPATLAYVSQTLLAIQTAGEADPARWGQQVHLDGNPFWSEVIPAYVHSLSPAPVQGSAGPTYLASWTGDGERYELWDHIDPFTALALHAQNSGNAARLNALRWLVTHTGPGGEAGISRRARSRFGEVYKRHTINYFLLMDPAVTPKDPRPEMPLEHYGSGRGQIFARTGWDPNAAWLTYQVGWAQIDHQHGDGLAFTFWRGGEWLTKERVGYGAFFVGSDQHNTLAIENDRNRRHDEPFRGGLWRRGSQWGLVHTEDPKLLAKSFGRDYVYTLGDATALYNSTYEKIDDVQHASRSLVWLKPDHLVMYDRAKTGKEGRFKRYFLHTPTMPAVAGNLSTVTTAKGQKLYVSTLLPEQAAIKAFEYKEDPKNWETKAAQQEPMKFTLQVEPKAMPLDARFLHVLQGASGGAAVDATAVVKSKGGTPFAGAVVKETVVMFPVDVGEVAEVRYGVPASVKRHVVTGLVPGGKYAVAKQGGEVTVKPGGDAVADEGGVLVF
ncbi:hypothetical protein [Chondromyces crocatus]|uniref:Heparinase n=1 Tax=Chondromyces crocatus TaxID=52 RepID=A0A0K1EA87_CHOCO|nr:hypothetical protein [Chondromyces crocatus]AKT37785.1 uncharacterized protein CMC5_019270 [Chondromyces crocatus]